MEVIIDSDFETASRRAAGMISAAIRNKPSLVLGLATGSTPLALYRELIRLHQSEGLSFRDVTTFNLDEYIGLAPDHPASYRAFMQEHLFNHIDIPQERTHIPDGLAADIAAHCDAYESAITEAGGIDIQILGLGRDGHIGFNEPSSSLSSRTRIKTLTPVTRKDNARYFSSELEIPLHVITMGVGTIMDAKTILLLAEGARKAPAVAATVEGPITASVPASALQLHRKVHVFLDPDAASRLSRIDYYKHVFANKGSAREG